VSRVNIEVPWCAPISLSRIVKIGNDLFHGHQEYKIRILMHCFVIALVNRKKKRRGSTLRHDAISSLTGKSSGGTDHNFLT
jgi:hypothetical protein